MLIDISTKEMFDKSVLANDLRKTITDVSKFYNIQFSNCTGFEIILLFSCINDVCVKYDVLLTDIFHYLILDEYKELENLI